ncbi:MAG TPA: MMPL family transporter [Acidimicrobiales bacterium]|nr:MMPL family transporter [Acidimicrobiales bacterium]
MLERLADVCYRRRWRVLLAWIALLFLTLGANSAFGGDFRMDFGEGNSESNDAFDILEERFPARAGNTLDVVYRADAGPDDPATQQRVAKLIADIEAAAPDLVESVTPRPGSQVPEIGSLEVQTVLLDDQDEMPVDEVKAIVDVVEEANAEGFQVEAGGEMVMFTEEQEFGSQGLGLLAAIVILLVAFGSVISAGLPITIAVLGLGIATGVMMLIARVLQVPDFAPQLADMMGIGVGIDYALFILARYKQGLRDGLEPRDAVVLSVDTAGRAVLFAGATVVIAILGMMVMGLGFLYGLAVSVSAAVLIVMLASITLLPALLGFVGHTIDRFHIPFVKKDSERGVEANLAHRWARVVQQRPWPAAIIALVILVALALPAFDLRFGFPDASNNPTTSTTRRAFDLQTEAFGAGANGPLMIVADSKGEAGMAELQRASMIAGADPGVQFVVPTIPSPTGDAAMVMVIPKTGPQEPETEELVKRLRDDIDGENGVALHVGGITAAMVDQNDYLVERLPWFIGAVVILSFLLLMVVFRSILVPLKAAVMNLLSIGAAYGIVSLSVNGGFVGDLIGIEEPTPVPGFIPMMMFAILFGLSMDYEVFLLSRIREEYVRTGDNASAVAEGLAATARVITAAAAIMVSVFGAFLLGDIIFVKMVGLGLATAIFIDATLVRMVLVPATMELLGDRNWWYPAWLDRITPHISVEGHLQDLDAELAEVLGAEPEVLGGEPERV